MSENPVRSATRDDDYRPVRSSVDDPYVPYGDDPDASHGGDPEASYGDDPDATYVDDPDAPVVADAADAPTVDHPVDGLGADGGPVDGGSVEGYPADGLGADGGPVEGYPADGLVADPALPPDHVDLDSDPFADDLSSQLKAAAPKRWTDRATVVLVALLLLVGGFVGGVQVEKHYGQPAAGGAASRRAGLGATGTGNFPGGFTRGGTGGASGAPSAGAGVPTAPASESGTITLVDGTTVYVTVANGGVLTVRTTSATKVSVGTATKVSQLKAGQKVTVTGAADSSGDVAATAISAGS